MQPLRDALQALPEPAFADLLESPEAYLLVIDLPGATAESTEASVSDVRISIEATRGVDVPAEFEYVEQSRETILDVELPLPPDATGVDADGTVDRGVLELRLPKRSGSGGATIPIEAA